MKHKRALAIILSTAMLSAAVHGSMGMTVSASTVNTPASDGVFWIEESDYDTYSNASDGVLSTRVGTSGTAAADTTALVSGGDAYWAWWGGVTYSATYKINVPTAGTYKLWYRGSDPTNEYCNTAKLKVNGTDITSSLTKVSGTDFTVKVDPNGTKKNFACAIFAAEVTFTSGENTISYEILTTSSKGKYAGLFDCLVIAPSSYEWASPSISTRPETTSVIHSFDSDGVAWIEESGYDTYSNANEGVLSTRIGTNGTVAADTTALVSGGDAYWAWWGGVTYSATYKIYVPSAGTYKLWYRGSDPTNVYCDTAKLKVNGTDITSSLSKIAGTDFTVKVDPSGTKKNFACAFFSAEVVLPGGDNTISYEILTKSTKDKYAGLFDCLIIAPSSYEWKSPTTATRPYLPPTADAAFVKDYNEHEGASVWAFTVTPGGISINSIGLKLGDGEVKWADDLNTTISGSGSFVYPAVFNKLSADIVSLVAYFNNNEQNGYTVTIE